MVLYILYETASGYALFQRTETDEIGQELKAVQQSTQDFGRFASIVKLTSFIPFPTSESALENINSISEGVLHPFLSSFLQANLPVTKKKKKSSFELGVSDDKLASGIAESLNISCNRSKITLEILRGIRLHFTSFIKEMDKDDYVKAQLGLGHSYSRAKVKFNVNRSDNMIIQSISLLDKLDKDINTFAMRVKEWYSYHFPELIKIVPDAYPYSRVVKVVRNKSNLSEKDLPQLESIVMDSHKAQEILDAAGTSMGTDISDFDLINITMFADKVEKLMNYRTNLQNYLKNRMNDIAPNLSELMGEQVGARLISHAGSLTNLAKYPASTVQILGAEKALFRALKTRGNTPKYGLIYHSSFIARAGTKNKGRISRYLANKASIASRIDAFSESRSQVFGNKLQGQVEERLKFFDTGAVPRKNLDVMQEAIKIVKESDAMQVDATPAAAAPAAATTPKADKKKKRKKSDAASASAPVTPVKEAPVVPVPPATEEKKKKKKKKSKTSA
eukprot:TRINITY_DN175_c1_g1_i1.p1 TRINITY_DN175_c1_g1~~TRINITY_DN175_c1_g1_i1.p1  ORF type:complete len:505 (+),score=121.91 TRINITY_DN175_c1_g1_i1:84-1598(+)